MRHLTHSLRIFAVHLHLSFVPDSCELRTGGAQFGHSRRQARRYASVLSPPWRCSNVRAKPIDNLPPDQGRHLSCPCSIGAESISVVWGIPQARIEEPGGLQRCASIVSE